MNKNRSWKLARASCSHARRLNGSRQSSRRSWRSLFHLNTHKHNHPPHDRVQCYSSAAATGRVGYSPCSMFSAAEGTHSHSRVSTRRSLMKKRSIKIWYLCVAGFRLLCLSVAGEIVQSAVLHKSSKGEDEADGDKKVHGGDVGNLW